MSFLREGIEDVRALVLPDAITADGHAAAFSGAILVRWRSVLKGVLYQIYVNGRRAGMTRDAEQRQFVVQAPSFFKWAARIEVGAVEPEQAHVNFADEIEQSSIGRTRIRLTFLRRQDLPADAVVNVYGDSGTGGIDYITPLNEVPLPVWPCPQDKVGFGLAQFGAADFGYDAAAAVGFGKGCFAYGAFGLDVDVMEWVSPTLPLGQYCFGMKVLDGKGDESEASETAPITVIPAAQPAAALNVATFDEKTNQLILSFSDRS